MCMEMIRASACVSFVQRSQQQITMPKRHPFIGIGIYISYIDGRDGWHSLRTNVLARPLTKPGNSGWFMLEYAGREWERTNRTEYSLSLVFTWADEHEHIFIRIYKKEIEWHCCRLFCSYNEWLRCYFAYLCAGFLFFSPANYESIWIRMLGLCGGTAHSTINKMHWNFYWKSIYIIWIKAVHRLGTRRRTYSLIMNRLSTLLINDALFFFYSRVFIYGINTREHNSEINSSLMRIKQQLLGQHLLCWFAKHNVVLCRSTHTHVIQFYSIYK